jgi:hypothetical protein
MLQTRSEDSILTAFRLWHQRNGQWKKASLRVFENAQSILRTCTVANQAPSHEYRQYISQESAWKPLTIAVIRTKVQLVPRYAFRERFTPYSSDEAIYFSDIDPEGLQQYPGSIYSFSELKGRTISSLVLLKRPLLIICKTLCSYRKN